MSPASYRMNPTALSGLSNAVPSVVPDEDTRDPRPHTAPREANKRDEPPKDPLDTLMELFETAVNDAGRETAKALRRQADRARYWENPEVRAARIAYQRAWRKGYRARD